MNNSISDFRSRYENHTPGLLDARHSYAVLCPLVEKPDGLHLLYEVRASNLRQGGEVCFPGGRMEPGETPVESALRETEEELNIPRETVEILGTPDFIHNQKGFLLRPVLGVVSAEGLKAMNPSPAEVAEVFTVPLSFFRENQPELYTADLKLHVPEDFPYEEIGVAPNYPFAQGRVDMPIWHYQGHTVWGMTARLTRQLIRE